MGDFRITIEAVGNHGCGRGAKEGDVVKRCGDKGCTDCATIEFVEKLKTMCGAGQIELAKIEHWPDKNVNGTVRYNRVTGGPVDDLLAGKRVFSSFMVPGNTLPGDVIEDGKITADKIAADAIYITPIPLTTTVTRAEIPQAVAPAEPATRRFGDEA